MASLLNQLWNGLFVWLLGFESLKLADDHAFGFVVAALIQVGLLINLVAVGALVFIWMERKIAGRIQDRLGPTRVGGKFGWLQTLADGVKLLGKEDLMPAGADKFLFRIAPYVSFCASLTAFFVIPFAGGLVPFVGQQMNVAVFFVLAIMGLEVFGVILAGYASASKWSLFGAMREAAQVVSYEVPMGLCVVVPVMVAGSMDMVHIADRQQGWFTSWYLLHDPFTFITFWVYFTCAIASVNRAPFDLAEAESELVAGFHTEYSGLRWSFFFMAEYGSMLAVSLLAAILFLGGWHGPIPVASLIGLSWENGVATGLIGNAIGTVVLLVKAFLLVTVMMWVRWTLPRLRIDQVMTTCLKYCVPIAATMFLGAALFQLWLPGRVFFGLLPASEAIRTLAETQPSDSSFSQSTQSFPRSRESSDGVFPLDSRLRGNDEGLLCGNDDGSQLVEAR